MPEVTNEPIPGFVAPEPTVQSTAVSYETAPQLTTQDSIVEIVGVAPAPTA